MPDVVLLAKAALVGALVAAAIMRLAAWGAPSPWRRSACWGWAIGGGILAASGMAGQWPHWPAVEDRARFLTLLVPLTLVVETAAASMQSGKLAWIARFALAAAVTPILLFNTVYLADLNGPGSSEWSFSEAIFVLCGLAILLAAIWAAMSRLESRTSTSTVQWVLVLDALATAVTVMLSGYYQAGILGLGVAGALAGATLASHFVWSQSPTGGALGIGLIGVFAVVLMGRFFGALSSSLAAGLLLAPLLAWICELPRLRKLSSGWRSAGRLASVAIALAVVVIIAERKFAAASTANSSPVLSKAD
jgi:hypothetical protein